MYVRVHACSKQCRACNHPLAFAHHPFSGQPPPSRPALPRGCHHPYHATPTLTATYTLYHRPPTSPVSSPDHPAAPPAPPVTHSSPSQLSVSTASLLLPSATHTTTTTTHSFHPSRTPSFSPFTYLSLSLSVSTSVFLKRPIQSTRRVRPYGAVSTGTPARSLKENAIIRRTSTNELIVGASRYRQYREVLYSTSPGATRL